MKSRIFVVSLTILMIASGCMSREQQTKFTTPGQHPASMSRTVQLTLDYLIYLPDGYGHLQKDWPLMVFLHGAGERGDDLDKVKLHGPPKLVGQGRSLPFIIVSPQCPEIEWWPNLSQHVNALIDEMVETYDVDEDRIYLTGLSMGGYGTWTIAAIYPQRFAAIAPVCGGGSPFDAFKLKDLPIRAFHGAKDPVVPLQRSQEMVEAINRIGGNAQLTVYPEAEHDSWTETYNNDKFYEWLLSHSRTQD